MTLFQIPYALLVGVLIALTALQASRVFQPGK